MKAYLIQYVLKSYLWIHHPLIWATTVLDHFLFICHKQHLWSDTHVIFPILAHWKGLLKTQNQNISNYYLNRGSKNFIIFESKQLLANYTPFRHISLNHKSIRYDIVFSGFHIKRLTFQNCFCFSFFGIIACLYLLKRSCLKNFN